MRAYPILVTRMPAERNHSGSLTEMPRLPIFGQRAMADDRHSWAMRGSLEDEGPDPLFCEEADLQDEAQIASVPAPPQPPGT